MISYGHTLQRFLKCFGLIVRLYFCKHLLLPVRGVTPVHVLGFTYSSSWSIKSVFASLAIFDRTAVIASRVDKMLLCGNVCCCCWCSPSSPFQHDCHLPAFSTSCKGFSEPAASSQLVFDPGDSSLSLFKFNCSPCSGRWTKNNFQAWPSWCQAICIHLSPLMEHFFPLGLAPCFLSGFF